MRLDKLVRRQISISLPNGLRLKLSKLFKESEYVTVTDFVRDLLVEAIAARIKKQKEEINENTLEVRVDRIF